MNSHPLNWLPQIGDALTDGPLPVTRPFTLSEAQSLGVERLVIRHLLKRGALRRVVRGVFVTSGVSDTIESRATALALVVPESAVVTDRTAAWLHGVDILPRSAKTVPPPISVYQRQGTRVRRSGVDGGRRQMIDGDVITIGGVHVTSPLRTSLDLGRLLWRFDALAAMDGFLGVGVSKAELLHEVDRFKGFRGVVQLRNLAPLADGRAESPGESALRLHWYDAGLPPPELQWWVQDDHGVPIYRLDIALPDLMFCAEYDGIEFHSDPEAVLSDLTRRKWLTDHRSWVIEVFRQESVYGRMPDATSRLAAAYNKSCGRSWN